jgi:hypothetical protein
VLFVRLWHKLITDRLTRETTLPEQREQNRVTVMMEPALCDEIDTYRFSRRIGTRSEAIRCLIKEALSPQTKTATE